MPGDGKENARLPETFSGCWVRVYTTGKKASPGFPTEKHSSLFDAGALSTIGMMLSISLRNSPEGILSVRPRRTLIPARGSRRDFSGLQGYSSENPVPMRSRAMPTGCQLRNLTAWRQPCSWPATASTFFRRVPRRMRGDAARRRGKRRMCRGRTVGLIC